MSIFSERPSDMRGGRPQDTFDFGESQRQAAGRRQAATGQRRLAPMDTGTIGIAMSAMAFYWLMPALMSSHRRRRRANTENTSPGSQPSG